MALSAGVNSHLGGSRGAQGLMFRYEYCVAETADVFHSSNPFPHTTFAFLGYANSSPLVLPLWNSFLFACNYTNLDVGLPRCFARGNHFALEDMVQSTVRVAGFGEGTLSYPALNLFFVLYRLPFSLRGEAAVPNHFA